MPERPGDVAGRVGPQKGGSVLDYTERLRRLAINDARFAGEGAGGAGAGPEELDQKTLALVRLAALVAVGGAVPSYGAHADAAVDAGATAAEIVDVLVGVIPIVGLPCVVATAPKLAMALGYDTNGAFEHQPDG
jgi:4-carboxymuconolactone decarboxylase